MDLSFTPGPWETYNGGDHVAAVGGEHVASCETKADARLIAAAPDMLAALQFIADRENLTFAECSDAEQIIERAKAAISKATS